MRGRGIAVLGACGGAGSSLLAGALALCAARRGRAVRLLDCDLAHGDLAGEWDAPGERTLGDLLPVAAELRPAHLGHVRRTHPSGVEILASPGHPGEADAWDAGSLERLLDAARSEGDAVLDLGSGLSSAASELAIRSDALLLVAPASLRGARRVLGVLERLPDGAARPRLVVNAGAGDAEIGPAALGTAVGMPLAAVLPHAPREAGDVGAGRWPRSRRGDLVRAICELDAAL